VTQGVVDQRDQQPFQHSGINTHEEIRALRGKGNLHRIAPVEHLAARSRYFWIIKILATTVDETAAGLVTYLTITRTDKISPEP
jgi:hypothetical protein